MEMIVDVHCMCACKRTYMHSYINTYIDKTDRLNLNNECFFFFLYVYYVWDTVCLVHGESHVPSRHMKCR